MRRDTIYYKQVQLLVRVLPLLESEPCFALKGGTAINLFYRDLPRLSVDIDLLYLPLDDWDSALTNIRSALTRLSRLIKKTFPNVQIQNAHEQGNALRLIVQQEEVRIKVELSPVIRGTVFPPSQMEVCEKVENEFGYAEVKVAALPDLYAGKICAALDRQHPRDLFDVKLLFKNEGFTHDLRKTFLVFLISHQRPMVELLDPHRKDLQEIFESEFAEMTDTSVTVNDLEQTRELLIHTLQEEITEDERHFLLSVIEKDPKWDLLHMENSEAIAQLPSVRWKLLNLSKMNSTKHKAAVNKLRKVLFG